MESNNIMEEIMQDIKEHLLPVVDNGGIGHVNHYNRVYEKLKKWYDEKPLFNEDGLNNCKCGAAGISVTDDGGSLIIRCRSCGNSTEEYLFGASSYYNVQEDIKKEWNDMTWNEDDQDQLGDSSGLYDSVMNDVSPSFDVICVPIGLLKGVPCDYPGCIAHKKDPCEVCGRINAGLND